MKPIFVDVKDRQYIEKLFKGWNETMIWSCLQGYMGEVWTDDKENPESAQIINGDFCFFAGKPNKDMALNIPDRYMIIIPQNKRWGSLLEETYGLRVKKTVRYAIKKEKGIFNKEKLESIVNTLNGDYTLKLIDRDAYSQIIKNGWSEDLCGQFRDYEDYKERGLGIAAIHKGQVVSGASSYIVYDKGIEIEIDTREDHRRKGLALCCGARLISECLERGLYPSWDAHGRDSVALAEKLGYHFDKEYTVYIMDNRN